MFFLRTTALVLITLVLGACATPMRVALTSEQRAKITELKAHVVVVQDEVIAAVQPSQVSLVTGGGLIGAMIDSAITNKRVKDSQQILGPFYASIEDLDYRKEFNEAIKRELANYPIKISQITTTPRAQSLAELNQMREQLQQGQALLVIYPRYFLTMDFRSLDAEAVVSMWVKGGPDNTPVQRGVLYYQSQLVGPGEKESMNLWNAQNAALFRSTLRESITETIKLVLMDLEVAAAPSGKPEESKTYPFNTGSGQATIKGQPLKESASRALILGEDKKLYSLPKPFRTTAMVSQ